MIIESKVVESTSMPVTLEEVKDHLKVSGTDEDSIITAYIKAATRVCEEYTGLSFTVQTRSIGLHCFPWNKGIPIPYGPVTGISSFTYVDADDADQVLEIETGYTVDESGIYTLNAVDSWPEGGGSLLIEYEAGFTETPDNLKVAVMQVTADLYEGRQGEGGIISTATKVLLDTSKVYWNAYL
jgi:uncharacterized phiE125 gp8 family phage protein